MPDPSGRQREAGRIRRAERAATVGRLMLGELRSWHEFLRPETLDYESLPRRSLQRAIEDIRDRLAPEIQKFCAQNFVGMDEPKLSLLYEEVKAYRGLELPLKEFEAKFARIKPDVLRGNPAHLTVSISLWGLQYKFPEEVLVQDLIAALKLITETQTRLAHFEKQSHPGLMAQRTEVASVMRTKMFAVRSAVLCCFNLLEAYLNGLAWDYVNSHGTAHLSNQQRKLLEDASSATIREKLKKFPQILTGRALWDESDLDFEGFISTLKPFRDSLVHPSPFSAPEKFGGYDKLRLFYRVDYDTALLAAHLVASIIQRVHRHVYGNSQVVPEWMRHLEAEIEETSKQIPINRSPIGSDGGKAL